ncbi:MAG: HAD family hydrolase [Lachnospiraceae bacterium]|nr:HAD family hydrolase [Lachnospiraceae bacterium]
MEKHLIKLIATDLDGTLLNSKKELPAGFMEWVSGHKEIKMVIASGRQYYNICKLFPGMENTLVFMADNGGLVFENDKVIYINEMKTEDVIYCIEQFHENEKLSIILSGEKSAYMEHTSEEAERNAHMYYEKLEFTTDLRKCIEKDRIIKIAVFAEEHNAEKRYNKLGDFHNRLKAVLSGDCWIDIANKTVDKGTAIKILQEKYGIKASECMAFGDYLNDMYMLLQCGESYAMQNAHPSLKEIAKYIALSNDDGGVMEVLRGLL